MAFRGEQIRPPRRVVGVRLLCGHVLLMRDRPMNPETLYGCTAGTGCGYNLAWVSWEDKEHNMRGTNPLHSL